MMNYRNLIRSICALAGAALIGSGVSAQDTVTLKVASFSPPTGLFNSKVLVPFLDQVVADSEGTLEYKFFPSGALGRSPVEQLKLVTDGVADMAFVIPSYTPGELDAYGVTEIPGVAENSSTASVALWRAYADGLLPKPEGVVIVGLGTTFPQTLHSTKPIGSLNDLDGMRIRSASAAQTDAVKALGATPISNLRAPEVAEGLSRGTADAVAFDFAAAEAFRTHQITPYYLTDITFGAFALMLPMNEATWNALPDPAKAAFEKHMGENFASFNGETFDAAEMADRQTQEAEGKTFVNLDQAEIDKAADIFEEARINWGAASAEQQEVLDHVMNTLGTLQQ